MDALDAAPLCPSPRELRLESVKWARGEILVVTAARRHVVVCPVCGHSTRRVHSRYRRTLSDLPWHGLRVRLQLSVRKFFCDVPGCSRRIFTERLPTTAAPYARRTKRAAEALRVIALALGGAGGARLAAVLGLGASATTLLHSIRSTTVPTIGVPRAVGIDDWAWRKGMRYGTIVVDLERSRVLDLLPDREPDTVAAWLRAHPGVEIISRDRSSAFAEAGRSGAPNAIQVADRFHLVKNLGEAVQRILSHHAALLHDVAEELQNLTTMRSADLLVGGSNAAGDALAAAATADARAAAESRDRRLRRYNEVMTLRASGATLQEIATALRMSIGTVHRWIHSQGFPERARQRREADPVLDVIRQQWAAGCHNAGAIWRTLRAEGFAGSRRTIQREVARVAHEMGRHREQPVPRARPPSPRHLAWLFGRGDAAGTDADRRFITAVCVRAPDIATVRDLAQRFVRLVHDRESQSDALRERSYDEWQTAARASELRGFARGLQSDDAAVRAALLTPWSNGPTEGHIHRLKLLKRAMYGRAKLDLLRLRMLAAG